MYTLGPITRDWQHCTTSSSTKAARDDRKRWWRQWQQHQQQQQQQDDDKWRTIWRSTTTAPTTTVACSHGVVCCWRLDSCECPPRFAAFQPLTTRMHSVYYRGCNVAKATGYDAERSCSLLEVASSSWLPGEVSVTLETSYSASRSAPLGV